MAVDSLAFIVKAFGDSIRATIRRRGPDVVGDSAALATGDPNDRRFLALQLGAGALVAGSITRRGADSIRVRLSVRDMSEARTLEMIEVAAPLREPWAALPNVLQRLSADMSRVNWGPKGSQPASGPPRPPPADG